MRGEPDLHGNAPDKHESALVLIDVINDLEFVGGDRLLRHARAIADPLAALTRRARASSVPVIYVNDNFGRWRSDFQNQVAHCLDDGVRGEPVVRKLLPDPDDYFVLKPKHSGFFSTTLDLLLEHLGAKTLILTGIATDNCVLFTANDAYLRDFKIVIPRDCVASIENRDHKQALAQMERVLKARVVDSASIRFPRRK